MSLSKRILIDSVLVLGILFLPWYVLAAAALLLYWKFELIEIIAFGWLMDVAYGSDILHSFTTAGSGADQWLGWIPYLPFAYGAVAAAIVLSLIKKRIR